MKAAIEEARAVTDKPSLICCQTIIGWGSPNKQGKEDCHGAALGTDEVALTRENIGWSHPPFEIPADIYEAWSARETGAKAEGEWNDRFENYRREFPELAAEFERRMAGELPRDWAEKSAAFVAQVNEKAETIASRKASQNALNGFGPLLPEILGGSADLAGSNLTLWSGCKDVNAPGHDGNYVYYGVREFGMSAIMNGIALHGGFKPYGATFLMFSEYARNALRMSALMKIPVIYVYTHDSIGLGEDGPTHQPVEQTATLRLIPNMQVWRPCDAVESAVAWKCAIERRDGPSALIFSRQNLPHMPRTPEQIAAIAKGGYVLVDCTGTPDLILMATGSEVELAVKAAEALTAKGRQVRVVSMASTNVFDAQEPAYRDSVLPPAVTRRLAIEAGVSDGWWKYVGSHGKVIGLDRFGESAGRRAVQDLRLHRRQRGRPGRGLVLTSPETIPWL
ncbi:transketolase family protein [Methylococcus capsulatus]|uniref:transketolase family protein n=1 Tax=Methylococcus capsulatus TaxID=414 RepID=UPI00211ADF9B|nr:transketolase [Methylococcus capsulatus]